MEKKVRRRGHELEEGCHGEDRRTGVNGGIKKARYARVGRIGQFKVQD